MTRKDFSDIINYIKNRPEERARLLDALGITPVSEQCEARHDTQWVSAENVGRMIGKSSTFVRRNIGTIFNAVRQHHGCGPRGKRYIFDKERTLAEWTEYIARTTSSIY